MECSKEDMAKKVVISELMNHREEWNKKIRCILYPKQSWEKDTEMMK